MAVLDGFCFEKSGNLADYAGEWTFNAGASISNADGPFGGTAPYVLMGQNHNENGLNGGCNATRNIRNSRFPTGTATFGFRYRCVSGMVLVFYSASGNAQAALDISPTGVPTVYRGNNGAVRASIYGITNPNAPDTVFVQVAQGNIGAVPTSNTWNLMELRPTLSGSMGALEIKVNGAVVGEFSGLNLWGGADLTFGGMGYFSPGNGGIADGYTTDTTGPASENGYLGDVRVSWHPGSAPGAQTDFAPTGAPTNWEATSGSPAAPATRYATGTNTGQTDLYVPTPLLAGGGAIVAVLPEMLVAKPTSGPRLLTNVVRSGTTLAQGIDHAPGQSPLVFGDVFTLDPATGQPWVALPQFGQKLTG